MPKLELTKNALIVRLNFWETLLSFQRDLHIPLDHVRGATDDDDRRGWALGIRSPGTAIPGIISAGTYLKGGDKQFVYITRGTHPVVIELNDDKWDRIILGVIDAKGAAMRINAAIKSM